ncbi:unnamed protein product [Moneuplotes crassus]|uniref:Uncharacterized protein n=1 Tax=Euplotes crassus TaxID=5936 RepID=A0AAD1Y5S0_EUPCR|nr:unnamed protein product [Moneuplotes crassus]
MGCAGSSEKKVQKNKPESRKPISQKPAGQHVANQEPQNFTEQADRVQREAKSQQPKPPVKKEEPKKKEDPKKKEVTKKKEEPSKKPQPQKKEPAKPKGRMIDVHKLSEQEFEDLKAPLFAKVMNYYDLKLDTKYQDSLEERVARLLTNDVGETLRTEVSFTLIQEFKKFMYLVAVDILEQKMDGVLQSGAYEVDSETGQKYFSSPFHPPHILDLVWRFIIQEGQMYADFCQHIVGGFIDRPNPRISLKSTLSRYNRARAQLEQNEELLRPYWGLWPSIANVNLLEIDYDYDILLHAKSKHEDLDTIREMITEREIDSFDLFPIKQLVADWRQQNINDLEDVEEAELDEDADLSKVSKLKNVDFEAVYDSLMEFEFHDKFVDSVCAMFNLTAESGQLFIREYKHFLYIYFLTQGNCAPSFEIDSFWDLHYASTKDYRLFCKEIFGEFLESKNYDYSSAGVVARTRDYKKTLKVYEDIFDSEPEEAFWEDPVDLTINSTNGLQHLNLFKYTCMCIYHKENEGLEYKNTLRRNKDNFDEDLEDEETDAINLRNKARIEASKSNKIFTNLREVQVIEDEESIDEEEEQKSSYKPKDRKKKAKKEEEKKNKGSKSKGKGKKEEGKDSESKVIFDPVLTKGGFKILPRYHNIEVFESEDIIDQMEDGLYTDYIHVGSSKFKEIFDVAILSRADVDIALTDFKKSKDSELKEAAKEDFEMDERMESLTLKQTEFYFNPKEEFETSTVNYSDRHFSTTEESDEEDSEVEESEGDSEESEGDSEENEGDSEENEGDSEENEEDSEDSSNDEAKDADQNEESPSLSI